MTYSTQDVLFDLVDAPIFLLEIDADGHPVFAACNRRFERLTGRAASDILGCTARDVFDHPYGEMAYRRHCEALKLGRTVSFQMDLPVEDRMLWVRTTLSPHKDRAGRTLGLVGTCFDLTAEKNALSSRLRFETLSVEMEQFVALAAHDLRSPLRNIAQLTDILRQTISPRENEALDLLDMMDRISLKTMDLIADVLNHAETASAEVQQTEFSFRSLCHDILDTLDPRGTHTVVTTASKLRADRTAMQIVLRNLTENALKHGGKDRLDIDITAQKGLPGMIDITLIDNGIGFSDAALKVMNGGHFRTESGYGLFGIKRLISARGGTLVATNLPDRAGAVVRFSLPGLMLTDTGTMAHPNTAPVSQPIGADRTFRA